MAEPVKIAEVLEKELEHLGKQDGLKEAAKRDLKELYTHIGTLPEGRELSALCFSGGGIRSATFNLGVLQALANLGVLKHFDYLSSVSGGGYIAGWLKAWMHREPLPQVVEQLARPARMAGFRPLAPEPRPIDHLREYSNYLTPRLGFFSADTWSAAAMIVRNLLLNWLVLVPALTAVVAVPQVALIVAAQAYSDFTWGAVAFGFALLSALMASLAIYRLRRDGGQPPLILLFGVLPLWLSALLLSLAARWMGGGFEGPELWIFCALWYIVIPLGGWLAARLSTGAHEAQPPARAEIVALVLSNGVAALLLGLVARAWLPGVQQHPRRFVLFAVPILLGLYLLARTLFVAFASLGERDPRDPTPSTWTPELGNADREWWARLSGWVLLLSVGWIGISALVLGGHMLTAITGQLVAAAGGLTGLITALLGASSRTPGGSEPRHQTPSPVAAWGLRLLAPATLAGIVLVLAELSAWAGRLATGRDALLVPHVPLVCYSFPEVVTLVGRFLIVPASCTLLSWLLGWVVNVNRFSLHGFYRNRLVRAYLGASNTHRRPNPFTGFDANDDVPLPQLAHDISPRPFSVINVTLNLVRSGENLAWQQRKAESFSMTPLYCGNFHDGYRPTSEYGGPNGISLGTAVTISGAAANPSSGYHSSPLVAFLMTLFNVRLGAWLGNPNRNGERVYRFSGPRHAWKPLFADLFSETDAQHAYVSLSDGGHFENLAIYEMVLRRCRLIVASDAGQDPGHDFEDLGNLIRKVRIDFGIPIEFDQPIRILARSAEGQHGLACALARIRYDLVDLGTPPGYLLYLKPTLLATAVPIDVLAYSRTSKTFPHETTADQFFTEAQFESYRALGFQLAERLGGNRIPASLTDLFATVSRQLDEAARQAGAVPPPGDANPTVPFAP